MKDIYLHKRKYVKFATIPTEHGPALAAFLVFEEGGEVVFVSEPRIIRYIKNNVLSLAGKTSLFLLRGRVLQPVFVRAVLSPYLDYFHTNKEEFTTYSPRAPTR